MSAPPVVLEKLLARMLPAADRAVVVSELREMYEARSRRSTPAAARLWYARETIRFVVLLLWTKVRAGERVQPRSSRGRSLRSGWHAAWESVTYGSRAFVRRPQAPACIVAAIALGIASATAVASVVDSVLLRPLPVREPERIVFLRTVDDGAALPYSNPLDVADWRARARSFSGLASFGQYEMTLQLERPVRAGVVEASEGLAEVLGVRALHGRVLRAEDHAPGARTVVVSHELWRDHLGGDPAVVGRSIPLDGRPYTVVGVLEPTTLRFPLERPGVWTGGRLPPPDDPSPIGRAGVWQMAVARLAPGVSLAAAQAEMASIAAALASRHPDTNGARGVEVVPLRDRVVGPARDQLLLLAGAVALLLLIAGSNVAYLLLAVSYDRRREFALRAALGATRSRIAGQILTESLMLAALGGTIGLVLARPLVNALLALYPGGLPREAEVAIDARVLLLSAAAIVVVAVAASLPSLMRTRRQDARSALRATERATSTRREQRFRAGLVMVQVALSVVLLYGASVVGRSVLRLQRQDPGVALHDVLAFNIALPSTAYPDPVREAALHRAVLERVGALPGVRAAGTSSLLPFAPGDFIDAFVREGHPEDVLPDLPTARLQNVTPGYTEAIGLSVVRGRPLTWSDGENAPLVALVNETLARRDFPEGAVGRRIELRGAMRTIVGVVSDKRHTSLRDAPVADLYVPKAQSDYPRLLAWVAVRAPDPEALLPRIREIVAELDPHVAIDAAQTMEARLATSLAPDRFRSACIAALALFALVLAAFGVYGVIGYAVARQTREIGIRLALGELPGGAVLRVVRSALLVVGMGALAGIALALAGGRLIEGVLFGVGSRDPLTLLAVPATFLLVALAAAYGPARRASRVDPVVAIRPD